MEYGFAGRPEPASVAAPWNHPRVIGHRRRAYDAHRLNQEQDQVTECDLEPLAGCADRRVRAPGSGAYRVASWTQNDRFWTGHSWLQPAMALIFGLGYLWAV